MNIKTNSTPASQPPADDRFVIITDGRSGSSYLCSCLNSHPELTCLNELFNPTEPRRRGVDSFGLSPHTDPMRYLEEVIITTRAACGTRRVGFNLQFRQNPAALDQFLDDPRQRIMLLSRRDKLAQWASRRLASVTGQWEHPKDDTQADLVTRIHFRLRRFTGFLVHQRASEQYVLRRRPDALHVYYEDIVQPDAMRSVLRFLSVDPQVEVSAKTRRQFAGSSTYERFTNPLVAAVGSRIGYALERLICLLGATSLVRQFTSD